MYKFAYLLAILVFIIFSIGCQKTEDVVFVVKLIQHDPYDPDNDSLGCEDVVVIVHKGKGESGFLYDNARYTKTYVEETNKDGIAIFHIPNYKYKAQWYKVLINWHNDQESDFLTKGYSYSFDMISLEPEELTDTLEVELYRYRKPDVRGYWPE